MKIGNLFAALLLPAAVLGQECSFRQDISLGGLPNDMTLRQYVNGDSVTFEVVYAGLGWVGVGYSSNGNMIGNQAVIGLPDEGTVGFYNLGGYTTDLVTPVDGEITDASIEQTDSETILRFTRSAIQDGQTVFQAGETSTIIYAVGLDNNLAYHAGRASADVLFDGCAQEEEPVCGFNSDVALGDGDITLRQYVNGEEATFEVVYAGLGWIGFGYSSTGSMIGNQAVIGLPDEGTVGFYNLGGYTTDLVTPVDGEITNASIEQTDTETILRFTRSTIENGQPVFVAGETSTVIYAVGSDNTLAYHGSRGSASVWFGGCAAVDNPAVDEPAPAPAEPAPVPVPPPAEETEAPPTAEGDLIQLSDDVSVTLSVDEAAGTVDVEVVYEGLGWVAFGVSPDGQMVGSECVIGLPDEPVGASNPAKYALTAKADSGVTPLPEGQQTLQNANIVQNGTHTILTFTKLLEESGELPISATDPNTFVFATGSSNTLGYHNQRSSVSLTIGEPATPPAPAPAPVPPPAEETEAPPAADGGPIALSDDVVVTLSADEAAGTVDVELVYEGRGWLAFGVSSNGQMIGSECVIGLPDEPVGPTNPAKYVLTARANSGINLLPEAQQTLQNANVVQNETHTVLTYTRLLEEVGELPISALDPNTFVFATGPFNTLGFHNQRSSVSLTIGSNVVQEIGLPTRKLWVAHGVMMAAAWGVLVPIAIGSSLLRNLLPQGLWFTMHFYSNSLAIVCTIIGFALAIKAINDETGGGSAADHFGDPKHRRVGLVVFLMTLVQVGVAYFRPHPPSPPAAKNDNADEENDAHDDKHHDTSVKSTLRFAWEIKHRLFAAALLGLAWYNVDSGIGLFAGKFGEEDDITGAFWGILCGIAGVVGIGYLIDKVKNKNDGGGSGGGGGPVSEDFA